MTASSEESPPKVTFYSEAGGDKSIKDYNLLTSYSTFYLFCRFPHKMLGNIVPNSRDN